MLKNITIPFAITKVDEEQRRVWGTATDETLDSQDDVLEYEASKKAVSDWMKVGNIREMHDGAKAVGKAFDAQFDDVNKTITVGSYISRSADGENTWTKVKEGILTGYSVGGKIKNTVVDKAKDAVSGVERTIQRVTDWEMSELSLVDNPANPSAQIVMIKSKDGNQLDYIDLPALRKAIDKSIEKHIPKGSVGLPVAWWVEKYQNPTLIKEAKRQYEVNLLSKVEKRSFTDKQRQDLASSGKALPDGSFPIETKGDLANAVKAYGRAKDKAKAKAHIISRAKSLGATSMLPDSWSTKSKESEMTKKDKLIKDFFGVATLVDAAMNLTFFQQCEIEEGDTATSEAVEKALDAIKEAAQSELSEIDEQNIVMMTNVISNGIKAANIVKKKLGKDLIKITATTPVPSVPGRKTNPAADDPEAVSDDDPTNAQEVKAPAGDDDATSTTTPDSPETGTPAAAVGDPGGVVDDSVSTSTTSDGAADAPTEEPRKAGTDGRTVDTTDANTDSDEDDEDDEDDEKSAVATLKKSVSKLQDQINGLTGNQLTKAVSDMSDLVKKVATDVSHFDKRLGKLERQPMPAKVFSAAYPAHEVIKGQENDVEDSQIDQQGMKESEIVAMLKKAHEYEANPALGSEQERGEIFRALWKVKDLGKYEKLIK